MSLVRHVSFEDVYAGRVRFRRTAWGTYAYGSDLGVARVVRGPTPHHKWCDVCPAWWGFALVPVFFVSRLWRFAVVACIGGRQVASQAWRDSASF